MLRRLCGAVAAGFCATLSVWAGPAWAHGADAPDGTDYRTAVTEVSPATAGLTLRTVEAGARLELTNRTGTTIEVLGYENEPYLEIRPDGVFENVHSPAVYLNATLTGSAALPADADPTLPPSWRRASTAPIVRWHDHRTHWMLADPPPEVAADPSVPHRIRDWVVPLRAGLSTMEARGTLDWVPPPSPGLWWAWSLLGALAVGLLGLVGRFGSLLRGLSVGGPSASPRSAPVVLPVLSALAAVAGLVSIAYAVLREVDAGNDGLGPAVRGLLSGQVWPLLTGLAAVAAAAYALRRRPAADFALALAATCVALFGGVTNAAAFTNGVVPAPGPPTLARLLVATTIALGMGVAVASALRLRTGRPSVEPRSALESAA